MGVVIVSIICVLSYTIVMCVLCLCVYYMMMCFTIEVRLLKSEAFFGDFSWFCPPYFMVDFSELISGKIGCFRWRFL
jgi:hypothetical protein